MLLSPIFLSLAALSGQAAAQPPQVPHRFNRIFISPMGEPFRPKGLQDDTLADWFQQADLNHDGQLTIEEMQKDAERFFALLDVNHDGEIDPEEITRYETVVAPEISTSHLGLASFGAGGDGERGGGRRRHGRGWSDEGYGDGHQGGARFGLLDLPEPVVSADSDFNRGVSLNEFRQAATQRFVALDVDHQGKLTLDVLETLKPPPPAMGNPPERKDIPLPDQDGPGN